jgi:hypothetical protein
VSSLTPSSCSATFGHYQNLSRGQVSIATSTTVDTKSTHKSKDICRDSFGNRAIEAEFAHITLPKADADVEWHPAMETSGMLGLNYIHHHMDREQEEQLSRIKKAHH